MEACKVKAMATAMAMGKTGRRVEILALSAQIIRTKSWPAFVFLPIKFKSSDLRVADM